MSDEVKLEPCPFCGRPVELRYERRYVGPDTYSIWCGFVSCGINPSTGEHLDEDSAIAAWNRRPSDGKLREALEAATDRCQKFLDTFGDLGDCVTQADINDWVDALATERKE